MIEALTSLFRRLPAASPAVMRAAITLAALSVALWAQWLAPPGASLLADEWLRDQYIQLQQTDAPEPRVLVVDIDEQSMAALGPWPWPRARLADLVETLLTTYGARGVALDIVLPNPADAEGDARLGMLARHGPLVLAQAFDYSPHRPYTLREGQPAGALPEAAGHAHAAEATGYIGNQPAFADAPHVGNIGFIPDPDGALRRLPLLTRYQGRLYPALSVALINCCGGGLAHVPAAPQRVSYKRDWTAYTVVSAADILAERIAPASASGRLVLVGSSSLGLSDRVATPLAANRPGLGVQAAMLSTLLDRQQGKAPAPWPGRWIGSLYALLCVVLAALALPRLPAVAGVGMLAALTAAWLALAYVISPHDPAFSTTGPVACNLFLLAVAVPYHWQLTQRRSRHLLDTLRQYVAPAVVDELLRSDIEDPLAPRQLEVTTLIADMEGYTTQVESLPVSEAARLTRDFLECLTGPVIEAGGTLDKYTGDGLVAFWGAPLPNAGHADLALDAASAIVERVRQYSRLREAEGRPPLRVRIGIDSGPAFAGDFGTAFRSIYTAVGDSVNTASRLEQAARDYPHDIIIGEGTVAHARRHHFLPLGERQLRGKEKRTILYTLTPDMDFSAPSAAARPEAAA
ncbi:CHASE2 domain-containing protein [Pseudoduganella namucuonensis]|uniref:Adenylate cyclase n=1 Tax=Pseudoduganella namucuonensis TaxID=1035707 RepID=A0A1I7FSA1_9BURK|nr:adenylate/guanylate cyclase domain-containing protein [Pseudoduganella namucuonensis]SFU39099.1 adenylate cyclase [Pseudoduganella namucuonensis]